MSATAVATVEELARWLHETWRDSPAGRRSLREKVRLAWDELTEEGRADYLAVAERLLADPPPCLAAGLDGAANTGG